MMPGLAARLSFCSPPAPNAALTFEPRFELGEGVGAMAHRVLARGRHLAKGLRFAFGHEDRIIPKAVLPAWRPDELAAHLAFEAFDMAVRPGQRKHRDEARATIDLAITRGLGGKAILN